jgi:hypothetical protein
MKKIYVGVQANIWIISTAYLTKQNKTKKKEWNIPRYFQSDG